MESVNYQAKNGNTYYVDVVQTDTYNGKPVYSATVYEKGRIWDYRNGGRYRSLGWGKWHSDGLMLESKHFESGILKIRGAATDYSNLKRA
jgi:hypothetical protein